MTSAGVVQDNQTANYTAYAADIMFEYPTKAGTFTATGQYLKVDFDDAYKTNFNPGDRLVNIGGLNGQKNGGYVKAAYILPIKIGKDGKLQPYVLYEDWKFAYLLGVTDQKIKQTGGGINYYIHGQNVRLTARVSHHRVRQVDGLCRRPRQPGHLRPHRQDQEVQHVPDDVPSRGVLALFGRMDRKGKEGSS